MSDPLVQITAERNLYRRLLELGSQDAIEPFLRQALALIVEIVDARQGYLELRQHRGDPTSQRWSMAHGCTADEIDGFREKISGGIIATTLAKGETIQTAIASDDPRFKDLASVATLNIEAVLCAPIGTAPALGVVYLQGCGTGMPFTEEDCARAELFGRSLAPFADRILARQEQQASMDPTRVWRQQLAVRGIVGRSSKLAEVFRTVSIAAPARISVLVTGPSGTGKSLLARAIHDSSPRSDGPFVAINCGAIPEGLVESELFGALPGAFTGATRRLRGKVEAAQGGTLFLDEVGDLPLPTQVKLLTLLQSGSYYQVGSERPSSADIRVIAATNRDLELAVHERRFREDLFHRLNVVNIAVPPLAERPEDVVPLAVHFCKLACEQNGFRPLELAPDAALALERADWPGNARELGNRMEWAVLQAAAEGSPVVKLRHIFSTRADGGGGEGLTWHEATRRFQAELLRQALEDSGGSRTKAAQKLGISRAYLYEAMRNLGIETPRK